MGSNGFVFYRQNRHFTSVKSGDSCIFKMGLFRNFMFFSHVALRPGPRRPLVLEVSLAVGAWTLGAFPAGPCGSHYLKILGLYKALRSLTGADFQDLARPPRLRQGVTASPARTSAHTVVGPWIAPSPPDPRPPSPRPSNFALFIFNF